MYLREKIENVPRVLDNLWHNTLKYDLLRQLEAEYILHH